MCVKGVFIYLFEFVIGGIVVGTGLNSLLGFGEAMVVEIFLLIGLLFVSVLNKFEVFVVYDV